MTGASSAAALAASPRASASSASRLGDFDALERIVALGRMRARAIERRGRSAEVARRERAARRFELGEQQQPRGCAGERLIEQGELRARAFDVLRRDGRLQQVDPGALMFALRQRGAERQRMPEQRLRFGRAADLHLQPPALDQRERGRNPVIGSGRLGDDAQQRERGLAAFAAPAEHRRDRLEDFAKLFCVSARFQQPPRFVQIAERLAAESEPVGRDRACAQEAGARERIIAQRRLERAQPRQHGVRRLVVGEIGEAGLQRGARIVGGGHRAPRTVPSMQAALPCRHPLVDADRVGEIGRRQLVGDGAVIVDDQLRRRAARWMNPECRMPSTRDGPAAQPGRGFAGSPVFCCAAVSNRQPMAGYEAGLVSATTFPSNIELHPALSALRHRQKQVVGLRRQLQRNPEKFR